MSEIRVCKAWGIEHWPVDDMIIAITETQPQHKDLNAAGVFFDDQARQIEEALHRSLPGGTYDRLTGRLLERKATHFRVRHYQLED